MESEQFLFNRHENAEREIPDELKNALSYLNKNGDFIKLRTFLKNQGVQESYTIDQVTEHRLEKGVNLCLSGINSSVMKNNIKGLDIGFSQLRVLKDTGLLSETIFQKGFKKFIDILKSEEGMVFTSEQYDTIQEKMKEYLDWCIV